MNTFLKTYRLALTPLSPIHIGCGEDFEPTNYVIDEGVLYGFDPSRAELDVRQRENLSKVSEGTDYLAIQRFFKSNPKPFRLKADVSIPVCAGIKIEYAGLGQAAKVEKGGKRVINQFFIERHEYTGADRLPYVPGSSFKGAVRTAILDAENKGKKPIAQDHDGRGKLHLEWMEKRLLGGGEFLTSPLRLLKVSDMMPIKSIQRKILYAVNLKKAPITDRQGNLRQSGGVTARKECIHPAQYRALSADVTLPLLGAEHVNPNMTPRPALRPTDLLSVGKMVNDYHLPRLEKELESLNRFVNPDWSESITKLIGLELKEKLQSGAVFLVRLGRYGGAESKTLSGQGVAQIKIMEGKDENNRQRSSLLSETKTVWLAAEHDQAQAHSLPFGWALVEVNPETDESAIRDWCGNRNDGAAKGRMQSAGNVAEKPKLEEVVWPSARIKFNSRNGTLTAESNGIQAHAIAPQGEALLCTLSASIQTKIRRNEFVKLKAWVVGSDLTKIEP